MTLRVRTIFLLITGAILVWFLYIERSILTPFILAAIFAYIFNPLVNIFTKHMKMPRTLAVALIYLLLLSTVVISGILVSNGVTNESTDLKKYLNNLLAQTKAQLSTLPGWAQNAVNDTIRTVEKSDYLSSHYILSLFPQAFSHILSVIIFLFSGFYFLKEGRTIFDRFINLFPSNQRVEVDILFRKINAVLGGYLRGQMLLIIFVATTLFIALSIIGVKFALIVAIFSGFAEIVPLIGPFVAAIVAILIVLVTGYTNFSLSPVQAIIVVSLTYLVIRQLQDYLVSPFIMGRITKLPSIIILFAVLAGEHLAGLLGLILAVPIAAAIKIILEFSLDMVTEKDQKTIKKS